MKHTKVTEICRFCKEEVATICCRMPKTIANDPLTGEPKHLYPCNIPMCDKCLTEIFDGVKICPDCVDYLKSKLGDD